MFWHPHQGLWNWRLVQAIQKIFPAPSVHWRIHVLIIRVDTVILLIRAFVNRMIALGPLKIFSAPDLPDDVSILYLDLGTHKEGHELAFMVDEILPRIASNFEAYGFEASEESYQAVRAKFSDRANVTVIRRALCQGTADGARIKLYIDRNDSTGNSLYREGVDFEEVEAMRLSDFLSRIEVDNRKQITLLRMNIEGAEFDVVKDLVDSGVAQSIDGYFGMWDDVSKIDLHRDKEFREFLCSNKIRSFPFNGRDMRWPLRRRCIAYEVETRILRAALTLRRAAPISE